MLTGMSPRRSLLQLKRPADPRELERAMAGLRFGSNVLQLDGPDPGLIASLQKSVGISGRACAVAVTAETEAAFQRSAAKAGALVEVVRAPIDDLPHADDTFDLVIIKRLLGGLPIHQRVSCLQQALRVLRPGGRCLVIDSAPRGGLGAVFARSGGDRRYLAEGGAVPALTAEGFLMVRRLGERDGLTFVEGQKPSG